ncbi:hypothetical protein [Marivita sp. GX14005]|uniref:hypothetical protein n=1 Tax=Marivita sp. GX14005 TaxID=2942276 RepID=UPI0020192617|nr:hypothetical protein [Marivita sp. GX14005]MCL3880988.1 hypothetical protein [Marivita sp. GX14005]
MFAQILPHSAPINDTSGGGRNRELLDMTNKQDMFDERYRRVLKRHRQLSRGYVTRLGKNGVIDHYPIGHLRDAFSLKALLLPIGILFFLKACMVTVLGQDAYSAQVALLREGSLLEQFGAFFLQMDPITWPMAQMLGAVIG